MKRRPGATSLQTAWCDMGIVWCFGWEILTITNEEAAWSYVITNRLFLYWKLFIFTIYNITIYNIIAILQIFTIYTYNKEIFWENKNKKYINNKLQTAWCHTGITTWITMEQSERTNLFRFTMEVYLHIHHGGIPPWAHRSLDRESNPRPLAYGNTASIEGTTTLTTKPNPLL
jgi:hypothetical protein